MCRRIGTVKRASRIARENRLDEALKHYDAALKDGISVELTGVVWYNKGLIYGTQKKYEKAEQAYLQCLGGDPPDEVVVSAFNNLIVLLLNFDSNRFHEAVVCGAKAISIAPNAASLWAGMAAALYYVDRYAEAAYASDQALALDSQHHMASETKQRAMYHLARMEEMLRKSLAELGRSSADCENWRKLLVALLNLGHVDEAFEMTRKALGINPAWHQIHGMEAAGWLAKGKWDEAIQAADRAIAIASGDRAANFLKEAALKSQLFEEKLNSTGRVGPSNRPEVGLCGFEQTVEHQRRRASLLFLLGDISKAIELAISLLGMTNLAVIDRFELCSELAKAGHQQEALRFLDFKLVPRSVVHALKGDILDEVGNPTAALNHLQFAARLTIAATGEQGGALACLLNDIGFIYMHRLLDFEAALPFLRRACQADSSHENALINCVECLATLGRVEEAKTTLKTVAARYANNGLRLRSNAKFSGENYRSITAR